MRSWIDKLNFLIDKVKRDTPVSAFFKRYTFGPEKVKRVDEKNKREKYTWTVPSHVLDDGFDAVFLEDADEEEDAVFLEDSTMDGSKKLQIRGLDEPDQEEDLMKFYAYLQVLAAAELKARPGPDVSRPPHSNAPALALPSSETGPTRSGAAASSNSV